MGLIKAGMGALGGTLADQWKEFFYCDSLDKDVLMVKGQKRTSRRSSNNGEDNIITNGSGIAVADGQLSLIHILPKPKPPKKQGDQQKGAPHERDESTRIPHLSLIHI